jgi:hypothetical protein
VSLPIFIQDTASTTGGGLSGLTSATSGLVAEYRRRGQSTWTTITLTSKTLGTWTSGGFVADGSLGGAYELDLPDAVCASSARWVAVRLRGAANMLPCLIEIELDSFDYQTATQPVNVTQFGGTNGTFSAGKPTAVLDSAVGTQITNIENAAGYTLAVLAGACADPQTSSETYAITVFGSTFTVDMAGQTSTGTRTAPTLTKA